MATDMKDKEPTPRRKEWVELFPDKSNWPCYEMYHLGSWTDHCESCGELFANYPDKHSLKKIREYDNRRNAQM